MTGDPWRVALWHSGKAFLPEARAYHAALGRHGFEALLLDPSDRKLLPSFNAAILFLGRFPRWYRATEVVVADYGSLSVGRFAPLKDLVKRWTNLRPSFGVYQNELIRIRMGSPTEFGYRPMGYFPELVPTTAREHEVDFLYVGTSERPGLKSALCRILDNGYSLRVVGFERPRTFPPAEYLGPLDLAQTYQMMGNARYGLNFVPNKAPFALQASTKMVEYLACGLGVVSSRTPWVERFALERRTRVAWLDGDLRPKTLAEFPFSVGSLAGLDWPTVIQESGALGYLLRMRELSRRQ